VADMEVVGRGSGGGRAERTWRASRERDCHPPGLPVASVWNWGVKMMGKNGGRWWSGQIAPRRAIQVVPKRESGRGAGGRAGEWVDVNRESQWDGEEQEAVRRVRPPE
jgi:hypothetical protein